MTVILDMFVCAFCVFGNVFVDHDDRRMYKIYTILYIEIFYLSNFLHFLLVQKILPYRRIILGIGLALNLSNKVSYTLDQSETIGCRIDNSGWLGI